MSQFMDSLKVRIYCKTLRYIQVYTCRYISMRMHMHIYTYIYIYIYIQRLQARNRGTPPRYGCPICIPMYLRVCVYIYLLQQQSVTVRACARDYKQSRWVWSRQTSKTTQKQMLLSRAVHQESSCPAHAHRARASCLPDSSPYGLTVQHTVALSPPRGALCVLPKSVSLLLLTSLYKIRRTKKSASPTEER